MSLTDRFKRAVRARIGDVLDRAPADTDTDTADLDDTTPPDLTIPEPAQNKPFRAPPPPRPAGSSPRTFSVGDRVIVQDLGFGEVTARTTIDHDGLISAVFEVSCRLGRKSIPEHEAARVMRHLVDHEGATIARNLLLADDVEPDPRPFSERHADLERALQSLDLGPEAKGVRDLLAQPGPLTPEESALLASLRTVVCDELEAVLALPPGSLARQLDARFGRR